MAAIDDHIHIENCLNQLFDDDEFDTLSSRLGDFNIFDAIGGVRAELRHSNFLAFLFSPNRSHGLGSIVLQKIIRTILDAAPPRTRTIRPLELAVSDIDDAIVFRERDNIDILIEIKSLKIVVLIENKVGSKASLGQLERYKEYIESRFYGWRHILVFLTPNGDAANCDDYIPLSYRDIAKVIEDVKRRNQLGPDQTLILSHYVEMLRRHIVPNEELRSLATRLYERHREAFDFVFEVRPQPQTLLEILKQKIVATEGLIEDRSIQSIVRFLPSCWDETLKDIRCRDEAPWTATKRGLLFEVKMNGDSGRVTVALLIGPIDVERRTAIYKMASDMKSVFRGISKPMGEKYSTIFSRELLSSALAEKLYFDQQCANAGLAWSEFAATELPQLIKSVEEIVAKLDLATSPESTRI